MILAFFLSGSGGHHWCVLALNYISKNTRYLILKSVLCIFFIKLQKSLHHLEMWPMNRTKLYAFEDVFIMLTFKTEKGTWTNKRKSLEHYVEFNSSAYFIAI